ncbi:hypothetical protein APS67_004726 [Streptomyces sp. AVP053U2]|nr:hypothetical protein APS67_004726 [Streptomyces sp. AVP053U2]
MAPAGIPGATAADRRAVVPSSVGWRRRGADSPLALRSEPRGKNRLAPGLARRRRQAGRERREDPATRGTTGTLVRLNAPVGRGCS